MRVAVAGNEWPRAAPGTMPRGWLRCMSYADPLGGIVVSRSNPWRVRCGQQAGTRGRVYCFLPELGPALREKADQLAKTISKPAPVVKGRRQKISKYVDAMAKRQICKNWTRGEQVGHATSATGAAKTGRGMNTKRLRHQPRLPIRPPRPSACTARGSRGRGSRWFPDASLPVRRSLRRPHSRPSPWPGRRRRPSPPCTPPGGRG